MNIEAIAKAIAENFPELGTNANDCGSLTISMGGKSFDIDAEGNVLAVNYRTWPDPMAEPAPQTPETTTPGV